MAGLWEMSSGFCTGFVSRWVPGMGQSVAYTSGCGWASGGGGGDPFQGNFLKMIEGILGNRRYYR